MLGNCEFLDIDESLDNVESSGNGESWGDGESLGAVGVTFVPRCTKFDSLHLGINTASATIYTEILLSTAVLLVYHYLPLITTLGILSSSNILFSSLRS